MHRFIPVIFFFIASVAGAQNKPLDASTIQQIKVGVAQAATKTKTISSDFIQEKEMSILNDKIITTGRFFFKQEQFLRWEYIHPFSYVIAIRGDLISIQDEGKVKSFNTQSNKVFAEVNKIIIGSVNGKLLDNNTFTATYIQNKDYFVVSLTPVSAILKESLNRITIYFNKKDFTVDKIEMHEPGGDFTRITFTNRQLNQPISDEVFILK